MSPDDRKRDHAWVQSRLGAWTTGLLGAVEAMELEAHLESCGECRVAAESIHRPEFPGDATGEHVPTHLIASWRQVAPTMRGLTRRLVRMHLEGCELCRHELEVLGHAGRLDEDPGLEGASPFARMESGDTNSPLVESAPPAPPRILLFDRERARAHTRRNWFVVAGVGIAAAAAAIVIVVSNPLLVGQQGPVATQVPRGPSGSPAITDSSNHPGPMPTPLPDSESPLFALGPAGVPALDLELESVVRGESQAPSPDSLLPVIERGAPPGSISLEIPEPLLLVARSSKVEIALVDQAGRVVRQLRTSAQDLIEAGQPRTLTIGTARERLTPGRYTIRFAVFGAGVGEPVTLDYGVVVR